MGDVNAAAETIRRKLAHRNGVTDPEGAKALDALVAERQQAIDALREAHIACCKPEDDALARLKAANVIVCDALLSLGEDKP